MDSAHKQRDGVLDSRGYPRRRQDNRLEGVGCGCGVRCGQGNGNSYPSPYRPVEVIEAVFVLGVGLVWLAFCGALSARLWESLT